MIRRIFRVLSIHLAALAIVSISTYTQASSNESKSTDRDVEHSKSQP